MMNGELMMILKYLPYMFSNAGNSKNPSRKASYPAKSSSIRRVSSASSARMKTESKPSLLIISARKTEDRRLDRSFASDKEERSQWGSRAQHHNGIVWTNCQSTTDVYSRMLGSGSYR